MFNNTIASPLKLSWNESEWQYKVNKPSDQSGLYVNKEIAENLLLALKGIIEIGKRDLTNAKYDGYFEEAKNAILKAESYV